MGEQKVSLLTDQAQMHRFVRHLLDDVQALQYMIENDWFETGITRIGAEQEMCIVDAKTFKPAPIAMEALDTMKNYPWVETELARFNLETNMTPRELKGKCLSQMEQENLGNLNKIRKKLALLDSKLILTGILPTLRKSHLDMHNLTPKQRYFALMEAINSQLIGNAYELRLTGIDELLVQHNSPLLEACNTSFQVHLQVAPKDFVHMYNISQAITAPIMAIAANSPIVFGRRLWHESRIALFQQSLDTRTTHDHMRERYPRVSFGSDWLKESVLNIHREDIARFRVLISGDVEENAIKMIEAGKVPKLRALQVHNSTVYRWNRPCYGISENGKPHLRIENRVLPSGPTVIDEMANAALWIGAMVAYGKNYKDISANMSFDDVRDNFGKAARFGIDSNFTWFKDKKISVCELIKKEILPMAREGLASQKVNKADIDRYLGVIEERADQHMNGARWQLRAYSKLIKETTKDEAASVLTAAIIQNQEQELPVHKWKMPELSDLKEYRPSKITVEEFMVTDVFTVQKDDIIELVAEMMDWRKIRYTPVEDTKGNLIGLVTAKLILRHLIRNPKLHGETKQVSDIMIKNPTTITPETTILDAMDLMRKTQVGCLPVVKGKELIGIITEMDFLRISGRLIERLER
ncbi:MAG: CBS domain-containing protein/gamma-glutamylcysteine synthetase [Saprospiraceae bacterium]|jgi:CBS domain-containing protein/gamma-glutamylcysteine synthetase